MTIRGLRTGPGAEASQSGVVIGRVMSTGAGELEEVPLATLDARLAAAATPIAITGDYSDATVLAGVVAALVATGRFTDSTTP
jgi:hypothetical protein